MKPIFFTAILAVAVVACKPKADGIDKLKEQRDSLKTLRDDVSMQIKTIEAQIALLDTNIKERVTSITTLVLEPTTFEHFFTVQGVAETDQNAQIFPEAPGKITAIKTKEGDRVSKGQVLMTIDSKVITNQIDELKSRLALVKTVYEKQEKLWKQNIGSEIQYLEAKNNFESLKQNLETLEAQRSLYTITAPFGGIVDEINPKVGEMASPAMPAIRLINTDNMYIKADITERYLGEVKPGDIVLINFPGVEEKVESKIERIGNYINPNNRTFKIKLNINNKNNNLKPNMLGELKVRDYVSDSAIVIPASLIQMTPSGEEFVYAVKNQDGKTIAQKISIKSGITYNNMIEIIEGLTANEILIDKGARSIKDGDIVKIEE